MLRRDHKRQCDLLASLGPYVAKLREDHETNQRLWLPAELLSDVPPSVELPPEAVAMMVLNLLTEEGLPNFHRLIETHLGDADVWIEWNNLWTAEEDRHGAVLHDFLWRVPGVDRAAIERMQYAYLRAGFRPDWQNDPYQLLAYTVLQERATQISHSGVASLLPNGHPLGKILGKIAGEEGKHQRFYASVFAEVLRIDTTTALMALLRVMRTFAMPGKNIPEFKALSYLAGKLDVFGPSSFQKIVEDTSKLLGLNNLGNLDTAGWAALEHIRNLPAILERAARQFTALSQRDIRLPFMPDYSLRY